MQTLAAWLQVVTSAIIVIRWFFSPRGKRFRKKVARIVRFAIDTFRESSDDSDDDDDTRTWCDGRPLFRIPSLIDLGLFSGYQLGSRAFFPHHSSITIQKAVEKCITKQTFYTIKTSTHLLR